MGKKYKQRMIPEQDRRICGSICLCQLTIVLSCVAIVYLSVAIYMPSYKAFQSGFEPEPVMCQTINTTMANNCAWASCGEWCLTKTSGFCPQIHTAVRRNGTDVIFENCTRSTTTNCPQVNPRDLKKFNCNNGTECAQLTGVFNCSLGHCANMSDLYECHYGRADGVTIDAEKDNMKLNGFFYCKGSNCTKIKRAFSCDRFCPKITTTSINVFIMHNDSLTTADCEVALAHNEAHGPEPGVRINPMRFWNESHGAVLTSCLDAVRSEGRIEAFDCLNGTLLPEEQIPHPWMNFTMFWKIYENSSIPVDVDQKFLPRQSSVTIYNSSKLFINLEGCVNTLRGECKQFLNSHGSDGDNNTAQARFPCFYHKNSSTFVVARFDLQKTWKELMIAVIVPTSLFFVSLVTLCIITQSVRVGDDAKMRCKYCVDGSDQDDSAGLAAKRRYGPTEETISPTTLAPSVSQQSNPTELNSISFDCGQSSTKSLIPMSPCSEKGSKKFTETLERCCESSLTEDPPQISVQQVTPDGEKHKEEKPLMIL
ncbi:ATPase, V0 complex, subunit e1/e2 [Sergentomyia squamirostris]